MCRVSEEEHLKFLVSRAHPGKVKEQITKYISPAPEVTAAGGAGYKIWEIIKGDYDVYVHTAQIKKWDLCAGTALLSTAQGRITDLAGQGKNIYITPDGIASSYITKK